MWGWLKPVLDFLAGLFEKAVTMDVKATEAKTTDETKQRFETIRQRIKPTPPPEPPADGTPR